MISLQLTGLWSFADFMTGFGTEFKKARESRGLTLEKIAAETRISTRFLKAIEGEEFHILPGGIFNRGFIKTYAQHLGLNTEQVLAEYERLSNATQQPALVDEAPPSLPAEVEPVARRAIQKELYPVAIIVAVLLILIFYLVNRNSRTDSIIDSPPEPAAQQAGQPPQQLPVIPAPPQTREAPAVDPSTPSAIVKPEPVAPPSEIPAPLVLELEAIHETWIMLMADGNLLEEVILQPGNTRRYEADTLINIRIGNAGGITMKVNGRELGMLGREGQTKTFQITQENAAKIGA